ncbi:hypothetical protein LTR70_006538 [Exophiala xenobiotica]|nr:hypothetical protein LTR70_006538 [Exophiala xenobiotica]
MMVNVLRASVPLAALAACSFSYCVYRRLAPTTSLDIITISTIPQSLAESRTNKIIVNPHNYIHSDDTREVRLSLDRSLPDEQILARFMKGFFGGWIFAPERAAMRIARMQLVQVAALGDLPSSERVWSNREISREKLPQLGTVYFGAFRVADKLLQERHNLKHRDGKGHGMTPEDDGIDIQDRESYIDFVFGSDEGMLRGVHRFSVLHGLCQADESSQDVIIRFSHTSCNPGKNEPLNRVLAALHLAYATLLFRDGVAEVLKQ